MSLVGRFFRTIAFPGSGFGSGVFRVIGLRPGFSGQVSIGFVAQRNNAACAQKIEPFVIIV